MSLPLQQDFPASFCSLDEITNIRWTNETFFGGKKLLETFDYFLSTFLENNNCVCYLEVTLQLINSFLKTEKIQFPQPFKNYFSNICLYSITFKNIQFISIRIRRVRKVTNRYSVQFDYSNYSDLILMNDNEGKIKFIAVT